MNVEDVQRAVESGIGGENIAENVEGRECNGVVEKPSRIYKDSTGRSIRIALVRLGGGERQMT
jgi:Cu(I)/Ag(I) efflux system membrane protein CusA/SilA